jgi:hypothetical protein
MDEACRASQDTDKETARKSIQNGQPSERPLLLSRQSSHSKRHASFNSPREVPLLSPSCQLSQYFPFTPTTSHARKASLGPNRRALDSSATIRNDDCRVFEQGSQSDSDSGNDSLPSAPSSPPLSLRHQSNGLTHPQMTGADHTGSYPDPQGRSTPRTREQSHTQPSESSRPRPQTNRSQNSAAGPVFPWSRPYSLPQNYSNSFGPAGAIQSPTPTMPIWPDRTSSASLPLPMQTPYFTLPQVSATVDEDQVMDGPTEEVEEAETARTRPPPAPSQPNGIVNGSNIRNSPSLPTPRVASSSPSTTTVPRTPPPSHRLDPFHASPSAPAHPIPRSVSSSSHYYYPPPQAPVILTPPPPPSESTSRPHAPYEPFLCHNAMAEDRNSIAVETLNRQYNLIVRLPGFSRDAITLATRRRRILHIVADSWVPGGGHFERRVSFGYDADLSQVRAEFDGDILQVTIPRRIHPTM